MKKDEDVELLDTMLTSLVDLLEEKGILTHKEWDEKVKENLGLKEK